MPSGLSFANANKYRRYPFSDDSDMSASSELHDPVVSDRVPDSFFRMFRAVVVHSGRGEASEVRLTGFGNFSGSGEDSSENSAGPSYWVSFGFFGADGSQMPLSVKDGDEVWDMVVPVKDPNGLNAVQLADFNFEHCVSLCFDVRFSDLPTTLFEGGLLFCSCSIPMAAGTLLSLEAPHIMSVLDDSGNAIRGVSELELVAGHNVKFDVMSGSGTVIVSPLAGAGTGRPFGKSGLSSAFASLDLRTVNGVSANRSGNLEIVGGDGIDVEAVPGTNIVNIYSKTKTPSEIGCEAK